MTRVSRGTTTKSWLTSCKNCWKNSWTSKSDFSSKRHQKRLKKRRKVLFTPPTADTCSWSPSSGTSTMNVKNNLSKTLSSVPKHWSRFRRYLLTKLLKILLSLSVMMIICRRKSLSILKQRSPSWCMRLCKLFYSSQRPRKGTQIGFKGSIKSLLAERKTYKIISTKQHASSLKRTSQWLLSWSKRPC